jgi:hypothetical protein
LNFFIYSQKSTHMKYGHTFLYSLHSSIFIHQFNYSIDQSIHMMENEICQYTLPLCGDGGGLPTYFAIYSFNSSI